MTSLGGRPMIDLDNSKMQELNLSASKVSKKPKGVDPKLRNFESKSSLVLSEEEELSAQHT